MTDAEFLDILRRGYETRRVECKAAGPRTDKQLLARVARAVMGMANLRDGGLVIIGVNDDHGSLSEGGLNVNDLKTWKYDDVKSSLAEFMSPTADIDIEQFDCNGRTYVLIHVDEFVEVPLLCARDYQAAGGTMVVRRGACYVRSRRKTETAEIATYEEMRELLDLAIDKGVARFLARARRSGLAVPAPQAADDKPFEDELGDLA